MRLSKKVRAPFRVLAGVLAVLAGLGLAISAQFATHGQTVFWLLFVTTLLHYGEFLSIAVRGEGVFLSLIGAQSPAR